MKASRWRTILLALAVVLILQEALTIYLTQTFFASSGVSVAGSVTPSQWRIAVYRDSTGYEAGLRDGDIVDASQLTPAQRFRLFSAGLNVNEPFVLPLVRNGSIVRISVSLKPYVISWDLWFAIFAGFWAGACAIVLAIRKPESREVQWLVLWLVFMRLNLQMSPTNGPTPYPAFDLLYSVVGSLAGIGWAFFSSYAASMLEEPSRGVRVLGALSYLAAAAAVVVTAGGSLAAWFGAGDPAATVLWVEFLWPVAWLLTLSAGFAVLARIRGSARERLAWTLFGATIYAAILLVYNLSVIWPLNQFFTVPAGVLQIVSPAILTYAMLNRRLLDIGFALNRAVVFSAVSLVVVGMFVLVEWAFGAWFAEATHVQNAIASGALALVLGLSIRAIHHRLDIVLDSVFFRKRHENEQALLTFAHEAAYITDLQILVERTRRVIEEHAGAREVRVALFDGATYGGVNENDPAIVSMRANHRVVDLHTTHSALEGEWAYPMVSRGRLVGTLTIGGKVSGESYAPDESAAILRIAHAVASTVDLLARNPVGNEALMQAIEQLQATVFEITRRMEPHPIKSEGRQM